MPPSHSLTLFRTQAPPCLPSPPPRPFPHCPALPRSAHLCAVTAPMDGSVQNRRRVAAPTVSGRTTPLESCTGRSARNASSWSQVPVATTCGGRRGGGAWPGMHAPGEGFHEQTPEMRTQSVELWIQGGRHVGQRAAADSPNSTSSMRWPGATPSSQGHRGAGATGAQGCARVCHGERGRDGARGVQGPPTTNEFCAAQGNTAIPLRLYKNRCNITSQSQKKEVGRIDTLMIAARGGRRTSISSAKDCVAGSATQDKPRVLAPPRARTWCMMRAWWASTYGSSVLSCCGVCCGHMRKEQPVTAAHALAYEISCGTTSSTGSTGGNQARPIRGCGNAAVPSMPRPRTSPHSTPPSPAVHARAFSDTHNTPL